MPKIVKSGGVKLAEDVYRIHDFGPAPPRQKKRPASTEEADRVLTLKELPAEGEAAGRRTLAADSDGMDRDLPGAEAAEAYDDFTQPVQGEIIQGAMAEASRILEAAVKTAESSKAEIMAQAHFEVEKLKKEAVEQGRREGFSSVIGEMREVAGGLEQSVARFEGERAGYEAEYEDHLKWFAIEIASKVLAKKVAQDDAELVEMVQKTMSTVQNEPWIRVEVAQEMSGLIQRLNDLFKDDENVTVNAVPAKGGTIQIETPSGLIDASLQTQLENLKEYFDKANP